MSDDARIAVLEARMALMEAKLTALSASATAPASDENVDLDSEWGNFVVKKDPTRWTGASYAGQRLSDCPAAYLLVLASQFDWMASKDEEQQKTYVNKKGQTVPTAPFKRKDAARCRGWAKRNAQVQPQPVNNVDARDLPF